jgi:hypothetical protein
MDRGQWLRPRFLFLARVITLKQKQPHVSMRLFLYDGPGRIRTCDRPVMHPTTAFTAPFGFVGWTVPSPLFRGGLSSGLYTFPTVTWGLARDYLIVGTT